MHPPAALSSRSVLRLHLQKHQPGPTLQDRDSRAWFAEVVASEPRPLLQEHWFDAPEDAEKAAAALLEGW
jgi:hypothetical protein